eukprot:218055_1
MCVAAGGFCDPKDVPGVAHFCEHMIFMGTEKYPEEDFIDKFVSQHGGSTNAYTADQETVYQMDFAHEHLEAALDRFAAIFAGPLFTESATGREIKAVDQEFKMQFQNDTWRDHQIARTLSDWSHPFHMFSIGNLKTLKEDPLKNGIKVRELLMEYYNKYYSANIMCLCVVGREPLDTLQEWVSREFSSVRNLGIERPTFMGSPFTPEYLKKVISHRPIKEVRSVSACWALPEMRSHYKTKEQNILSHLLGHEGPGSILSYLKKRKWANELSAGGMVSFDDFSIFMVQVDLTEEGLSHAEDVLHCIFQYLERLRGISSEEWKFHYEEIRDVSAMNFRFKSKEQALRYASMLCVRPFALYEPQDLICGPYLMQEFSEQRIHDMLANMTVDNFRYSLVSKDAHVDQTEEYFGVEYSVADISTEFLKRLASPGLNPELVTPKRNEFIATDFTIFEPEHAQTEMSPPKKIISTDQVECWHLLDTKFKQPKGHVNCLIVTPELSCSPRASVLGTIYCAYVKFALTEYAYDAEIAGLGYALWANRSGIRLTIHGYNQKLFVLFEKIIQKLTSLKVEEDRFEILKKEAKRNYMNFFQDPPYKHAMYNQRMCLENKSWHVKEYLAVIDDLSGADLEAFMQNVFTSAFFRCSVMGNLRAEDAKKFCECITSTLKFRALNSSQHPDHRVVRLGERYAYTHSMDTANKDDPNSAIVAYFQIAETSIRALGLLRLCVNVAETFFYNQLRKDEQLGYLVFTIEANTNCVLGFRVLIQSGQKKPDYLDGRVEACMEAFGKHVRELSLEDFNKHRLSVIAQTLEKDQKLSEAASRFWDEIWNQQLIFDRAQQLAAFLESVSPTDLVEFFTTFLAMNAPKRAKLVLGVVGPDSGDAEKMDEAGEGEEEAKTPDSITLVDPPANTCTPIEVNDFSEFKRTMQLFPDLCAPKLWN